MLFCFLESCSFSHRACSESLTLHSDAIRPDVKALCFNTETSFTCSGVNAAARLIFAAVTFYSVSFLKIDRRPAAAGLQSYRGGWGRVGEGCLWWVMGIGWGRVCWVGWGLWMINTGVRI